MTRSISSLRNTARASITGLVREIWPTRPARHLVDVRELPDHLKRDLGILDGSRPVGSIRW